MPSLVPSRVRTRLVATAVATVAAVAAAVLPAAAQAAGGSGCPPQPLSHPFLPWGDDAPYQLAPDGGFEAGAAPWALTGGAAPADGNEPFHVGGAADARSLALPAGSSATSARFCIGIEHRTMRFFAKRNRPGGALKVEVLFRDLLGRDRALAIARLDAGASWSPTPIIPLVVNILAVLRANAMEVALRITPQGGSWSIDDVYVDPYRTV